MGGKPDDDDELLFKARQLRNLSHFGLYTEIPAGGTLAL